MGVRLHLFRDETGDYRLGDWHLFAVRIPVNEPPVLEPPPPDAEVILHIHGCSKQAVLILGQAEVLHEELKHRDGPDHRCAYCENEETETG